MKIFSWGYVFWTEWIEVADATVITLAFIILIVTGPDSEGVAGIGLLRMLRLAKLLVRRHKRGLRSDLQALGD